MNPTTVLSTMTCRTPYLVDGRDDVIQEVTAVKGRAVRVQQRYVVLNSDTKNVPENKWAEREKKNAS